MLKYCTDFNVNVACLTYFQNGAIHVPPRMWGALAETGGLAVSHPGPSLNRHIDNLFQFMDLFMLTGIALT